MEEPKKKGKVRSTVDKLVMGAIIGGAIGSVLGMVFAPRKGKETRKIIKDKGRELYEKHEEDIKKLKEAAKNESKSIWSSIKNTFNQNDESEKQASKEDEI